MSGINVSQAMNGTNASQAMRGNSFLVRRQVQPKAGATASLVFAVNAAVGAPGNRAHQGQPQAQAAGALAGAGQAVEGLEDAFALVRGHARATVTDLHLGVALAALEQHGDVA